MTNADVAAVLDEIADLMEIGEEQIFKVRSYRRAAETVAGLGEEIRNIHAEGALEKIPGIGKSLAAKIAQFIETGEIDYRSELLAQYPETILELLAVPGFGPKKAGLVHRELGIGTVDELEAAATAQRLRDLKGMGPKSEQKLLRSIEIYHEGEERTLLGTALPIGQEITDSLRSRDDVIAVELAGSLRRRRETIGDFDILATSDTPATVCQAFAAEMALEEANELVVAGDTKVTVRLASGMNLDLRVVPPESYGAALVYFTGSKQHNVDLRERCVTMGLTLNEYGLFEQHEGERGRQVAGQTEQEIYQALGLTWIPPELREARGEIQAAEQDALPQLIEPAHIRSDLQMHTTASDGHTGLEDMVAACRARGYDYMGITDHSPSLTVAGGLKRDELLSQIEMIRNINQAMAADGTDFTVLAGIEADILGEGRLDVPAGCFEELDFVIGSIHQGFTTDADKITARIVAAFETGQVDIFAHPTGRVLLRRDPYGIHMEEVIEAAVRNDVALEINAFPQRLDLNDVHSRLAAQHGAKISINTDAHDAVHLEFMQYGVMTARRGWVEPATVINTWPLEDLRAWLTSRRR